MTRVRKGRWEEGGVEEAGSGRRREYRREREREESGIYEVACRHLWWQLRRWGRRSNGSY